MRGDDVLFVSGGDDHQTYVVTTAYRLGREPAELAQSCNDEIKETLRAADVEMDAFTTPNAPYREHIGGFFADLYERGVLETRKWSFPWSPGTSRYLLEAFSAGFCPSCLTPTSGAICEECGHPNDVASLLYSYAPGTADESLEYRPVEILVLPLEKHRARIRDHFERHSSAMRPHVLRFVKELLAKPLPDFPVTYPADWGVPVPIPGFEDQVVNVWAEMLPGLIWMTDDAVQRAGIAESGSPWDTDSGWELVQFLGFDNTFYFSFAHLALALGHGEILTTQAIVTNEFYLLENTKFSTSRRHLIWARDLVERYGADHVRFYLSLTNPETQQTNFAENEFVDVLRQRLHVPLRRIEEALQVSQSDGSASETAQNIVATYSDGMRRAYELETFSLREAARLTANLLGLIADRCTADPGLALIGLAAIAAETEPLMPTFSGSLSRALNQAGAEKPPALLELLPEI